jgi:glycosyltransferase involved in cell wall biosynthesis
VRIGLAITSHERPDALAAVLASVSRQRVPPAEIILADDGSGAPTRALIEDFARDPPAPVRLVTQTHEGFRAARLRNLAVAASSADFLVFVDGDMLLHREFVADHARCARPGFYTQGVRVPADARLTARLIADREYFPTPLAPGLGTLRRAYLLHSPAWSAVLRRAANRFVAIKSCNLGVWRADLLRVNGFNEEFVGWGPEDKELCARLAYAGVRRQTLVFGGIACHLYHPPASRAALPANLALLAATRATRRVRAEHGMDTHLRA